MRLEDMRAGVVTCLRLYIFAEPDTDSEIVCKIRYLTDVLVDLDKSTDKFYKIYTVIGASGYCIKEHIIFKK